MKEEEDLSFLFPYMMLPEEQEEDYIFGQHLERLPDKTKETELHRMI